MDPRERYNDPEEVLSLAQDGLQARIWTALPCVVESYDAAKMTLKAQPAIKGRRLLKDGTVESIEMPLLGDVPVLFPRGGGFTMTFPIAPGDECLVIFASRCIDGWWQSGGEPTVPPPEFRMHDLSDGFALVGMSSQVKLLDPPPHTANTQLRADDGETYIEVTPDQFVKIVAPGGVTVDTDNDVIVTAAKNVTANVGENAIINADGHLTAEIGGNVNVNAGGNINADAAGQINMTAPIINLN